MKAAVRRSGRRTATTRFRKWPLAAAASALFHGLALANPDVFSAAVENGAASFSGTLDQLTLHTTDKTIIRWQDFSIGGNESVYFDQPSASASVLNRVVGGQPSAILGNLGSNGRVYLVNPSGIVFVQNASVNVGALVASTLDIGNDNFINDNYLFESPADSSGTVRNRGTLIADDGGFVVLAGAGATNEGLVIAQLGAVALISGSQYTLDLDGSGLVNFAVTDTALSRVAGVHNLGAIVADGGVVTMAANVARELVSTAVNNRGLVRAHSIVDSEGTVSLIAHGGDIVNSGTIDVSGIEVQGFDADGGFVNLFTPDAAVRLQPGSTILANGTAGGFGGGVLLRGGEQVTVASDVQVQARGGLGGGRLTAISGGGLALRSAADLGAGGSALLAGGDLLIGDGTAADGCNATVCSTELAAMLRDGTDVSLVGSGITLADLASNALDAGTAEGSGGGLFLGIGRFDVDDGYIRGSRGSVRFTDRADRVTVDRFFTAQAGIDSGVVELGHVGTAGTLFLGAGSSIDTGGLAAAEIFVEAGGSIDVGALAASNISLEADGRIVAGAIEAVADGPGAAVRITAGTGVHLQGPVSVHGRLTQTDPEQVEFVGARLRVESFSGNIRVDGAVSVDGTVDAVLLPGQEVFARGGFAHFQADQGGVFIGGPLAVTGMIGAIRGGEFSSVVGAHALLVAASGPIVVDGSVSANGHVGSVKVGNSTDTRGTDVTLLTSSGNIRVNGSVSSTGTVDDVLTGSNTAVTGSYLSIRPEDGSALIGADVTSQGAVGSVRGGSAVSVRGAEVALGQPIFSDAARTIIVTGDLRSHGSVGQYIAASGEVIGGFLKSYTRFGQTLSGTVAVNGIIGTAAAFDDLAARGAYLELESQFGGVRVQGPVLLDGHIDRVRRRPNDFTVGSGFFVNGARLAVTATFGDIDLQGDIGIEGNIGTIAVADNLNASGAEVLLTNDEGAIALSGDLNAHGSIGKVSAGDDILASGVYLELSSSLDDVSISGALTVSGELNDVSAGFRSTVDAVRVLLDPTFGNVSVDGPIDIRGTVGRVSNFSDLFVSAVDFAANPSFGNVRFGMPLKLLGTVASVETGNRAFISGASLRLTPEFGDISTASLDVDGSVRQVQAGTDAFVGATNVSLITGGGAITVDGDIDINGAAASVIASDLAYVNGSFVEITSFGGDTEITGNVTTVGTLGSVSTGVGSSASGAQLIGLPDGDFRIGGAFTFNGSVASFTGENASGVFGASVFLFSGTQAEAGDTVIGGPVNVSGSVGEVLRSPNGSDNLYVLGAFASFLSYHGKVDLQGAVNVSGSVGAVAAGNLLEVTGAGLWLAAGTEGIGSGEVHAAGPLTVTGSVGAVSAGDDVAVLGALTYVSANDGSVVLDGAVTVGGTLGVVSGGARVSASGAQIVLERDGDNALEGSRGSLLAANGAILQQGSIAGFEVSDPTSGEQGAGGVLIDAGDGSVSFTEVGAEDIYVYFNADSALQNGRLSANNYLEIVTPTTLPTLSATSLSLSANQVYVSANLDAGTLNISGGESLSVFGARLHASQLSLQSGGILRLSGIAENGDIFATAIIGDQVSLSGSSVVSDRAASIDAGGLSVRATEQIVLGGRVDVGTGLSGVDGDAAMIEALRALAPELAPQSTQPNAFFEAPTVALAELHVSGDYVRIQSDVLRLGTVSLPDRGLFHIDPLNDLPFFTESVDVTDAGLDSVKDRLSTEGNRITPNLGRFNDEEGGDNIGDRAVIDASLRDATAAPEIGGSDVAPNLGEVIKGTGLTNATVVIGASDYNASLQISDRLAVNVLPHPTNFVFMTNANILIAQPIQTNGQVIVLQGNVLTDPAVFYAGVREEIVRYYMALEAGSEAGGDGEVIEKSRDEEADCE